VSQQLFVVCRQPWKHLYVPWWRHALLMCSLSAARVADAAQAILTLCEDATTLPLFAEVQSELDQANAELRYPLPPPPRGSHKTGCHHTAAVGRGPELLQFVVREWRGSV